MAFRIPTHAPQRQSHVVDREESQPSLRSLSQRADDTQEWVLFSPQQAEPSTSSTDAFRSPAFSRLSDFGSLNTPRSGFEEGQEGELSDILEDTDELDSLDDGLNAFAEPSLGNASRGLDQSGGAILPTHDGLGTFQASSAPVQDQLWSHERFNPDRRHAQPQHIRVASLQKRLDAIEDDATDELRESLHMDRTRMERIEKWRVEQSKILIEEISRETAVNRGKRKASEIGVGDTDTKLSPAMVASMDAISEVDGVTAKEPETIWQRITRRVIRDLIGIDDSILAVILGESLPGEEDLSKTPTPATHLPAHLHIPESEKGEDGWEDRILRRLARELGILVHQLSGVPKTVPKHLTSGGMDYAGIPITKPQARRISSVDIAPSSKPTQESAQFRPTLDLATGVGSPSQPLEQNTAADFDEDDDTDDSDTSTDNETDYWERTPDLRTIFSYLSPRFVTSRRNRHLHSSASSTSNIATTHTADSLRRAAIIRQHHPLVSREERRRRASLRLRSPSLAAAAAAVVTGGSAGGGVGLAGAVAGGSLKRAGTSCASWSTRRNWLESEGGSRHYWDIGGSVGSGEAAWGGVGAWGEV